MKYFCHIRYVGTNFSGFQVQPGGVRTVQGVLSDALRAYFGSPCKVTGASRTDAGVHAEAFAVTVENDTATTPPDRLPIALIPFLPEDLSVTDACLAPENFHVRYDVESKEYRYTVYNAKVPNPFLAGRVWHLPRRITDEGMERMKAAAAVLVGKHDFSAFMAEGSDTSDTVRTVYALDIARVGDSVVFTVSADGFLYNMVRIIVGTLTEAAFGRFSPDDFRKMLASGNRAFAGMTAPAAGLTLMRVTYPAGLLP